MPHLQAPECAERAGGLRDATAGVRERGGTTLIIPDHRHNRNGRAGSGATGGEQDETERAGLVSGQCRTDVRPSVEQQWHGSHVRADGGCQGVRHGASRGEWAAGVR